jgi:hypothetical protein
MSTSKINDAVTRCLERCYTSRNPMSCLADFMLRLEHDRAWSKEEISAVETAALKMLVLLAGPASVARS